MTIEGIPEGWELVRIGKVHTLEYYLDDFGRIMQWKTGSSSAVNYVVVRKIEKPKKYRPFANAAEFEPHRVRWWKKTSGDDRIYPPCYYNDSYCGGLHFEQWFIYRTFDDGSPFGIEVTE